LTTEERLSDIVEILAHGLLWLDAFSVDLCSHIGSCAALAHVASWHFRDMTARTANVRYWGWIGLNANIGLWAVFDPNETLDTWAPRESSRLLRSLLSRHRHGKNLDGTLNMKLYVTYGSPYARLARIIVIEKALEDRVEIIEAKTRTPGSPYYRINPSGRVPYLIDDTGVGMEDSQLICAYLDSLDGKPRFHNASHASDWAYLRFEFAARSMCDGIAVWGREIARPENERSPTTLAHEAARAQRMADFFEHRANDPVMQGSPCMAHLIIAVAVEMARKRGLGDLTADRPRLANWMRSISDLPSMQGTVPP
jgi:glutathione S-transferase